MSESFDSNVALKDHTSAKAMLQDITSGNASMVIDNAVWDEAYINTTLKFDPNWVDSLFSIENMDQDSLDGVIVFGAAGEQYYKNIRPDHADLFDRNAPQITERFIKGQTKEFDQFVQADGSYLIATTTARIRPHSEKFHADPTPEVSDRHLLFIKVLNRDDLAEMSEKLGLPGLRVSYAEPGELEESDQKLDRIYLASSGNTLPYITWDSMQVDTEIFSSVKGIYYFIIALFIIGYWLIWLKSKAVAAEINQASAAKSRFIEKMTHEIRSPLNAISGFAELLKIELDQNRKSEKTSQYVTYIQESSKHLVDVASNVLDLRKIEEEMINVSPEVFEVSDLIDSTCKMFIPQAREKNIHLSSDAVEACLITSDPRLLKQILINFITNAVKFTGTKGEITVGGELQDDIYMISVSDTGIGMSPRQMQQAMEYFGQPHRTASGTIQGTGLGLPISAKLIECLDGEFDMSSEPGVGTTVEFKIPIYNAEMLHMDMTDAPDKLQSSKPEYHS